MSWILQHMPLISAGAMMTGIGAILPSLWRWVSSRTFGSRRSNKYWDIKRFGDDGLLRLLTKKKVLDDITHEGDSAAIYGEVVTRLEYILIGCTRFAVLRSYVYTYRSQKQWQTIGGIGGNLMTHPPSDIFPGMTLVERKDAAGEPYWVKVPCPDVRVPKHDMVLAPQRALLPASSTHMPMMPEMWMPQYNADPEGEASRCE